MCTFTFRYTVHIKSMLLFIFPTMYRRLTNLFLSCLLCTICLLGTTQSWAQVPPGPATINGITGSSSTTLCSGFNEFGVNISCPTSTTASWREEDGTVKSDGTSSGFFVLYNISSGLTTYTIICTDSGGETSRTLLELIGVVPDAPPTITSNLTSSTVMTGGTFSLTAICGTGAVPVWNDDNTAGSVRTITAPASPIVLTYEAICKSIQLSRCESQPEQINITVLVMPPGSPTLTFGTSATFCVPTESCGGVFLYNSVVCPVGWLFSYRDPGGLLINTNAQSGPIQIPYAPSKPPVPLRILNYTAICSNPSTGQTTSTPLTIYVDNAPYAPALQIVIKP